MLVLILDSKTALEGATEGIQLCLHSAIPSLFPFFIFSTVLTSFAYGKNLSFLQPVRKICGIPRGSEALILVGFLGGYPTGAQGVTQAYETGRLSRADAQRMLGFCNNAGPAFIFGLLSAQFEIKWIPLALWLIHLAAALLTGYFLPEKSHTEIQTAHVQEMTWTQALIRSVKSMSYVCGWIVLFRVAHAFLQRWILWLFPAEIQVIIAGALELTNGCCILKMIENIGLRFIVCSIMLSFGGLCVGMQTFSVCSVLGTGRYFHGKLIQTLISAVLSYIVQLFFFKPQHYNRLWLPLCALAFLSGAVLLLYKQKKRSRNSVLIGV